MPEMLELGRLKQKQNRRITPGLSQPGLHGKFQVRRSQECLPKTLKKVGTGGLKRWPGGTENAVFLQSIHSIPSTYSQFTTLL